jgi:hypothetical protein
VYHGGAADNERNDVEMVEIDDVSEGNHENDYFYANQTLPSRCAIWDFPSWSPPHLTFFRRQFRYSTSKPVHDCIVDTCSRVC